MGMILRYLIGGRQIRGYLKMLKRLQGIEEMKVTLINCRVKAGTLIDTCGYTPQAVSKSMKALFESVKRYIFISSVSVYKGFPYEDNINEKGETLTLSAEELESATDGVNGLSSPEYYGPLKFLNEQEVINGMTDRSLIIRPGLIVGPHDPTDRFTYWPYRVALGGKVLAPPNKDIKTQFIDVRDLAKWVILMAENEKTGVYNATGPVSRTTMETFLNSCKEVLNENAEFVWAEEGVLEKNKVAPWMELPLWIPANKDIGVNIEKAVQDGLVTRPINETIKDTYEWDRNRQVVDRQAGLNLERESEILKQIT